MSTSEIVGSISTIFLLLSSIIGFFIVNWMGKVDKSIEDNDTKSHTRTEAIKNKIDDVIAKINIVDSKTTVVDSRLNHLQKQADGIEKISDSVNIITGKVLVIESKVEFLGRVTIKDK